VASKQNVANKESHGGKSNVDNTYRHNVARDCLLRVARELQTLSWRGTPLSCTRPGAYESAARPGLYGLGLGAGSFH
jgi:hypothetical protein